MNLNNLLKVPIYFKILRFFHENPSCIDTPRGVAAWTNETRQNAQVALSKLAAMKILTAHNVSSTTAYSYTRSYKLIKKIDKVINSLKGRSKNV
ncbi:MAG: hypothetical protein HY589_01595 [Candidatus Omnitrophica bacterium]|nr:hypothetical protein [Candidatus Omnitrophota bacterium]